MNDQSAALYFRMVVILQSFGDDIQLTLNGDRLRAIQAATQKDIALVVSSTVSREENARLRLEMLCDCVNRLKFGLSETNSAAPPPARGLPEVFADLHEDRTKAIAARIIVADILFKSISHRFNRYVDLDVRKRLQVFSAERQRDARFSFWPKGGLPDRKNIDAACELLASAKSLLDEETSSKLTIGERIIGAFRLIGVYRRDSGFIVGHEVSWEIADVLKKSTSALLKEALDREVFHRGLIVQTLAVLEEIKALI